MSSVDRTLTCADCGVEFIHSAADQEFYAQKGFASDPKQVPLKPRLDRPVYCSDRLRTVQAS